MLAARSLPAPERSEQESCEFAVASASTAAAKTTRRRARCSCTNGELAIACREFAAPRPGVADAMVFAVRPRVPRCETGVDPTGQMLADRVSRPTTTLFSARSSSDGADSDRSRHEAKQARLASARQRQHELQKHGVAAAVLLSVNVSRAYALCASFARWRAAATDDSSTLLLGAPTTGVGWLSRWPNSVASPAGSSAGTGRAGAASTASASTAGTVHASEVEAKLARVTAQLEAAEARAEQEARRASVERALLRDEMRSEWNGLLLRRSRPR